MDVFSKTKQRSTNSKPQQRLAVRITHHLLLSTGRLEIRSLGMPLRKRKTLARTPDGASTTSTSLALSRLGGKRGCTYAREISNGHTPCRLGEGAPLRASVSFHAGDAAAHIRKNNNNNKKSRTAVCTTVARQIIHVVSAITSSKYNGLTRTTAVHKK